MKNFLLLAIFVCFFFFNSSLAFAESSYVLPYPGIMPGNKLYKLSQLEEKLLKYWYFGSFASFDYNRKYADKYLVEAKTLFEYDQYLLGYQALLKSNNYFQHIPLTLLQAAKEGKDISEEQLLFTKECEKHREVLQSLLTTTPETVNWTPEKEKPSIIPLHNVLVQSIAERKKYE